MRVVLLQYLHQYTTTFIVGVLSLILSGCDTQMGNTTSHSSSKKIADTIYSPSDNPLEQQWLQQQSQLTQLQDSLDKNLQNSREQQEIIEKKQWQYHQLSQQNQILKEDNTVLQGELKDARAEINELQNALGNVKTNCDLDKI
jgi:chromosome segregation ATPase